MNVLFISIAWPLNGGRNLYSDLMEEFIIHGHDVYVIGATPLHELKEQGISIEKGIHVLRINSGPIRKSSVLRKGLSLLTLNWKIHKALNKHFSNVNFDLIISHTPPITLSTLFIRLKRKYKAPLYLLLKDVWPQGAVDNKVIRKYGLVWLYLRFHEVRTYKAADYIGCMSQKGVDFLLSKNSFLTEEKLEVCPNSIYPSKKTNDEVSSEIREKYGIPKEACVFIFSGNLGKGHGLGFLVEAIKQLSTYEKAFFLIGGSGTHFKFLQQSFDKLELNNVLLYSWLPEDDFNQIMQTSDVGLVLLDQRYTFPQFPSRLSTYLDNSKAVLCAVDKVTDIGKTVEENGAGISLLHGDFEAFKSAVYQLSENSELRNKMGKNAHKLFHEKYTPDISYNIIINHFNK